MGAQQSTRRLTVINDEAAGVIKITDSVVDRIKSELHEQQSAPAAAAAPAAAPTQAPPPEPMAAPPPPPPAPEVPPPAPGVPPPAPPYSDPIIKYVEVPGPAPPPEVIIKYIDAPPPPPEVIVKYIDAPPPPPEVIVKVVELPPPPPIIEYIEKPGPAPPPEVIIKYIDAPPPPPEVIVKYVDGPSAAPPEIKYVEKPVVTYVDKIVEKPVVEYVEKPVVVEKVIERIVEKETGLTSLRIRAEKEKELQEAEAYWSKRFAKQEQEHTTLAHLEAATMNETVERLSKAFSIQKLPINPEIQKKRDELLQCYQQNPGKTLLCSEVVKDFSRSVHSSRTASG